MVHRKFHLGVMCAGTLALAVATPAFAQDRAARQAETEAARTSACEHPSLAAADREACAQRMAGATTDEEREAIRLHYSSIASGNRIEGDAVPTAAPPAEPVTAASPEVPPTPGEEDIPLSDKAWLFTVAGGAAILGIAIFWGVTQRRRRSDMAKAAQDQGTRAAYGRGMPNDRPV